MSYVKLLKVYLGKDILEIAVRARADYRSEEISNRSGIYRKAAYYQFCGDMENSEREVDV